MLSSTAAVPTDRADRLIKQIVSHLGRRLITDVDAAGTGTVTLSDGHCTLVPAEGALYLAATAKDQEALDRVQDVVARHLARFAGDERLDIRWIVAGLATPPRTRFGVF